MCVFVVVCDGGCDAVAADDSDDAAADGDDHDDDTDNDSDDTLITHLCSLPSYLFYTIYVPFTNLCTFSPVNSLLLLLMILHWCATYIYLYVYIYMCVYIYIDAHVLNLSLSLYTSPTPARQAIYIPNVCW